MKKLIVFGTRPEFIKLIPLIVLIHQQNKAQDYLTVFTGQHNELTQQLFEEFSFRPDLWLDYKNGQSNLATSFASIFDALQQQITELQKTTKISWIIGQGDTTSCACAALFAFLAKIPFAHIEAGLRTKRLDNPFPEEYYRKLISQSASLHFAPTQHAVANLKAEGIHPQQIFLSGNTVVDTLHLLHGGKKSIADRVKNTILITCHRRENQGLRLGRLIEITNRLAKKHRNYNFIWLSHPNPETNKVIEHLAQNQDSPIRVLPPLKMAELIELYRTCKLIVSDSGGIQEEATEFSIPVIVIREATERIESIELGYSFLAKNLDEQLEDLFDSCLMQEPINMINPYGDGKAAARILTILEAQ